MKNLNYTLCLLAIVSLNALYATPVKTIETIQEKPVSKASVADQINNLLLNSVNYNDVKLVKKNLLEELKADFQVFSSKSEGELALAKNTLAQKNKELLALQFEHTKVKTALSQAQNKDDEVAFFGFSLAKDLYHAVVWTLVLTSLIAVVFLVRRFKKANEITQNSKGILKDLEDEFETFKRNTIEREQKLRRQLQDEINKQKAAKKFEVNS